MYHMYDVTLKLNLGNVANAHNAVYGLNSFLINVMASNMKYFLSLSLLIFILILKLAELKLIKVLH